MAKIDLYSKDWCELIFANRNKKYGAYQLRAESGERNSKAKREFFAILNFIGLPVGRWACSVRGNLWRLATAGRPRKMPICKKGSLPFRVARHS